MKTYPFNMIQIENIAFHSSQINGHLDFLPTTWSKSLHWNKFLDTMLEMDFNVGSRSTALDLFMLPLTTYDEQGDRGERKHAWPKTQYIN